MFLYRFGLWLQSFFLLSWEPCELLTVALASLSGQHVVIAAICTDPHSLLRSEAEAHVGWARAGSSTGPVRAEMPGTLVYLKPVLSCSREASLGSNM